ncbi:hypothetical protein KKD03_03975 [Patescibacteria group bacterium]|nr:hypothetical protein [Patescibacteria group bacterium]
MENKAYLVIGIPTYCEANNISSIVKKIDDALVKYAKKYNTLIINADNNSPDGTKQAFLSTETKSKKIYLKTTRKGKGRNIKNILQYLRNFNLKALLLFDGDVKNLSSSWVDSYISSILKGSDLVVPLYSRQEHDGAITNHVCRPIISGIFNKDIKQPIGGDFALSKKCIDMLLKKKMSGNTLKYGIDIFITFNALNEKLKIDQVFLGEKIHSPSLPKLDNMYIEVLDTLFDLIKSNQKLLVNNKNSYGSNEKQIVPISKINDKTRNETTLYLMESASLEYITYKNLLKKNLTGELFNRINTIFEQNKSPHLTNKDWQQIVISLYQKYSLKKPKINREILRASLCLFFLQHASFIMSMEEKNGTQIESILANKYNLLDII